MRQDALLELGDAQAVTASAASTNVINNGVAGNVIQPGAWLEVRCDTTGDSSGDAATMTIALQTSATEAFSVAVTLAASAAIVEASLVADTVLWRIKIPTGLLQYIRVYYTIGTEDLTSGAFDAHIVNNIEVRP